MRTTPTLLGLVLALLSGPARAEEAERLSFGPFMVYQYVRAERARDDPPLIARSCDVPAIARASLAEYARRRWSDRDRIGLLRAPGLLSCPVSAYGGAKKGLLLGGLDGTVAAARLSQAPPSEALLERLAPPHATALGWPVAPASRKALELGSPATRGRFELRLGLVCWPKPSAWPEHAGSKESGDAVDQIGADSPCELWLLPTSAAGEPDPVGRAYLLAGTFTPSGPVAQVLGQTFSGGKAVGETSSEPIEISLAELIAHRQRLREVMSTALPGTGTRTSTPAADGDRGERAPAPRPACDQIPTTEGYTAELLARFQIWAQKLTLPVRVERNGHPIFVGSGDPERCAQFRILVQALSRNLPCDMPVEAEGCRSGKR